ncbi:MAG: sensor histidine kinase [Rhizobacter sp.]
MDDSVTREQAQRLRMITTSAVNYLFCAGILGMYALAGSAPWHVALAYLAVSMAGNAVFYRTVHQGHNLRLEDPNLFGAQMVFGGIVVLVFLGWAPQVGFVFLASLFVTGVFGLVQFDAPQLRLGWMAMAAGLAVVFSAVGLRLRLPASSPLEVFILWIVLLTVLARFLTVGAHVGFLRRRLREQNRQLRDSIGHIASLATSRSHEEEARLIAEERQRIMREIHDGIGANLLTAFAMLERGQLPQVQLAQLLRECIDDLMLTVDSLEFAERDLVALLATLRYRLEKRLLGAGIDMDWRVTELPPIPWLESSQALSVLRLAQEALVNVVKHARATSVRVATWERHVDDRAGVEVVISDNGVGFDPAHAPSHGHGLRNMHDRAHALGGHVEVASAPGATTVTLWLPLHRPASVPQ